MKFQNLRLISTRLKPSYRDVVRHDVSQADCGDRYEGEVEGEEVADAASWRAGQAVVQEDERRCGHKVG